MKVILLAPTPPPTGGIAMWTVRMMKAELKNGWQVEVVDEKIVGKREFFGDKCKHNIKDEMVRCIRIWNNLNEKLKDKNARVVHACIAANTMPVLRECVSALITKIHGRKFITHFRCTVPNIVRGSVNRIAVKWLCNLSDCVMLLNQASVDYVNQLSNTHTELIPNFVEENEIEESHRIREKIEKVVYAGGVIKSKGCLDLIEVAKAFPDIRFMLIGRYDSVCKEEADKISNVVLTGPKSHEEVHRELMDADVFAFLTYFPGEGFSNSLAEAMACGVPCLVSDWAANRDMVEGKGGFVVPIKNVCEAIQAIRCMIPPQIRTKQSSFNIYKINNFYRDRIILEKYIDCYEEVISNG